MKYKKIIITACVAATVVITAYSLDFGSILMRLAGHSMNNSEHSTSAHNTPDTEDRGSILNSLEATNKPSAVISTADIPNINTPPKKKEPELTNVIFIDYVVNPADTLWKITRNYMPDYPAQDTEDTIGIITYIAEKNNLAKGSAGSYVIYYGQKLKIPAQLSIVSNVIKQTSKTAAAPSTKTTTANKTNTSAPSNNTETSPATQAEHDSHNSH